jgi:hypothetical protein
MKKTQLSRLALAAAAAPPPAYLQMGHQFLNLNIQVDWLQR